MTAAPAMRSRARGTRRSRAASELVARHDRAPVACSRRSAGESVGLLDERDEARLRRSGGPAGAGGRRRPRRSALRRGTTTGRLPFASATMTEPTPACVTTTRARRIVVDHLLEREEVDELGTRRPERATSARAGRRASSSSGSAPTASQQPVEPGLVRPDADEDHRAPPRRRCRRSACRAGGGELRPLHVAALGDRCDQPVAERGALDPREALDVDDLGPAQPGDPSERHRDAGAGCQHDPWAACRDDAPGDERGCEAGS